MRIVYHCNIDLSRRGGATIHVAEVVAGLRARGHEVRLVAPATPQSLIVPDVVLSQWAMGAAGRVRADAAAAGDRVSTRAVGRASGSRETFRDGAAREPSSDRAPAGAANDAGPAIVERGAALTLTETGAEKALGAAITRRQRNRIMPLEYQETRPPR